MSTLINPFTIFIEANYTNPSPATEYIKYLTVCLIPLMLIFIYNFAFNRMSNASFCNTKHIKCQPPTNIPDPENPHKAAVHCEPYDLSSREPESTKGLAVLNWSLFGLVAAMLATYIALVMTIGSGPTTMFYIAVGVGAAVTIYMLGAAIDTQVNKDARRAVIQAGVSVMLILLSGLTVAGVEFGLNPIVLAILGLAIVIPTITTIATNKDLYDKGYVELPVFKGLANSMFSVNIVYLIYMIVAIGILYGKEGLTLDTLRQTDTSIAIILALLVQIIIHSVFIGKCSTPDYNCVPTLKTERTDGDLTYEQSCKLKTSNNMSLRASRIVLGVIGGIILLVNLGPIIQTIKLTMSNNAEPVFYIPVALAIVAAILSYMNIWERKLIQQPEDQESTITTTTISQ
jgi:hypothetical protein